MSSTRRSSSVLSSGRSCAAATLLAVSACALGMVALATAPAQAATPTSASSPPTVSTVSPATGTTAGGTKITITGQGFTHVHSVTFGSAAGRSVHVESSHKLQVTTPKHSAITVYVRVHTGHGTSAKKAAAKFRYATPSTKGAISGTVTAKPGGKGVSGVDVEVFGLGGKFIRDAGTANDGSYKVTGLPGGKSYHVCTNAESATKGSVTGYVSRCYKDAAWDGITVPDSAKSVHVSAGRTHSGVDIALPAGAAISGTVTAADGGAPLRDVTVDIIDRASGDVLSSVDTGHLGRYVLTPLRPSSSGYIVCFDASQAEGGPSGGGYLSQCYQGVAWDGETYDLPDGLTKVPATSGSTTNGIDASLASAATISGTVTAGDGGGGVGSVHVELIDAGNVVADGYTDDSGAYSVIAPPDANGYYVCFDASSATGGSSTTGYLDQCYIHVFWSGDPAALSEAVTRAPATAGATTRGVNAALNTAAAIGGTVTAASGGTPLEDVQVVVFDDAGTYVASATTDKHGTYSLNGLAPSNDGYYVCFDASTAGGGDSAGGYVDQCYDGVEWDGYYDDIPGGATQVPATAGTAAAASAQLASGGAISGTVTAVDGGASLQSVYITVIDANQPDAQPDFAQVDENGTFLVAGLHPGSYYLCFDGSAATGGPSVAGYLDQCYDGKAWDGVSADVPLDATKIQVTAGTLASGNDAQLEDGTAISGRVTASDGTPLSTVYVYLFDGANRETSTVTDANGDYELSGLSEPDDAYRVCFDGSYATDANGNPESVSDQCYVGVAWDGSDNVPDTASDVPVTLKNVTSDVNATLPLT